MDAMFIHLFVSPVTNGLIIYLSPRCVISCFLMEGTPPRSVDVTASQAPRKDTTESHKVASEEDESGCDVMPGYSPHLFIICFMSVDLGSQ